MKKFISVLILLGAGVLSCNMPFNGATPSPTNSLRLAVGEAPESVELADLNGDGKTDIVVANFASSNVTILLGDGRGGFKPAQGSPFSAGNMPNDIGIGDFNRDGKPDLAFPNHETQHVTILDGDGRGGFKPAQASPLTTKSKPHPHGIAVADFNGDQNPDIAVESWETNQVEILFGNGHGGFSTPGPLVSVGRMPYQRLRAGDFNKDGAADIVTTNFEGKSLTILLSDGKGGFKESNGSPFLAGEAPFGVAVGDLNKDGNPDLAVVNYSGSAQDSKNDGLTVLFGDGRGGFKIMTGSPLTTGRAPTRVAIGDMTGDGIPDIVVSNFQSQNLTILPGNSQGNFGQASNISVGREPKGIALGDLNGDGKADIVVANSKDNDITLILGQ
jgi:FG-GAP-like repeat